MIHVLVNPKGASGKTLKVWENEVEPRFKREGIEYVTHFSTLDESMDKITSKLTKDAKGMVNLVVVGGDGSINELINGIEDFSKTRVGIIPCGSGNDLARDLQLSSDLDELVSEISKEETQRVMDVGEVIFHNWTDLIDAKTLRMDPTFSKGEYSRKFINACGMGFDAEICQKALFSKWKKPLNKIGMGHMIYTLVAIQSIFGARKETMNLTYGDGRKVTLKDCLFFVGMNHRYEGGGFQFCPEASDHDGLLDFCYATPKNNMVFFRIFPSAYKGNHVKFGCVGQDRSESVHIQSRVPMWIETDGEIDRRSSDVTMKVHSNILQFLL